MIQSAENKHECEINGKRIEYHALTSRINLPEAIANHPGMEYIGTGSIAFLNGEDCGFTHPHHFFKFKQINPVGRPPVILKEPKNEDNG